MSTENAIIKNGHPVAGIILGIMGIAMALLMTLLFGVIAGAAAGVLGIAAALLGLTARRNDGQRGVGAVVAGVLAVVLAVTMTFTSVNTMKHLRDTAAASGVAPTFTRYMDNPYLGLSSVVMNAVNDKNDKEAVRTIESELDALNRYVADSEKAAAEKAAAETAPAVS